MAVLYSSVTKDYGTTITPIVNPPSKYENSGVTIQGMSLLPIGLGRYTVSAVTLTADTTNLYTVWKNRTDRPNILYFDVNGGTGTVPPIKSNDPQYQVVFSSITTPTKSLHKFTGWYSSPDDSSDEPWTGTETISDIINTAGKVLYARYEPHYCLEYDANGGTIDDGDKKYYNITKVFSGNTSSGANVVASYGDNIFTGWTSDSQAKIDSVRYQFNSNLTKDTYLYAIWDKYCGYCKNDSQLSNILYNKNIGQTINVLNTTSTWMTGVTIFIEFGVISDADAKLLHTGGTFKKLSTTENYEIDCLSGNTSASGYMLKNIGAINTNNFSISTTYNIYSSNSDYHFCFKISGSRLDTRTGKPISIKCKFRYNGMGTYRPEEAHVSFYTNNAETPGVYPPYIDVDVDSDCFTYNDSIRGSQYFCYSKKTIGEFIADNTYIYKDMSEINTLYPMVYFGKRDATNDIRSLIVIYE